MLSLPHPSCSALLAVAALCICSELTVGSARARARAPGVGTARVAASADPLASAAPAEPPELEDPLSAPPCEGLRVSIVIEAEDPTTSMATLSGPGGAATHTARVGTRVSGATVAFIGTNPRSASPAVWLTSGRGLCQSLMFSPGTSPGRTRTETEPPSGERPSMSQLFARLRVLPETRDGKVVGMRVLGVTPGSFPALLGLSNGDLIQRVNGYELANVQNALMLYARLPMLDRLEVELERRGEKVTHTYFIR
jgi:general secretion pathway protein C